MKRYTKEELECIPLQELDELLQFLLECDADTSYISDVEATINDKLDEF